MLGIKDLDIKILNYLDDIDLKNVFEVNKSLNSIGKDDIFWMNRVYTKFEKYFGDKISFFFNNGYFFFDKSWKTYYCELMRCVNEQDILITTDPKGNHSFAFYGQPIIREDFKTLLSIKLKNSLLLEQYVCGNNLEGIQDMLKEELINTKAILNRIITYEIVEYLIKESETNQKLNWLFKDGAEDILFNLINEGEYESVKLILKDERADPNVILQEILDEDFLEEILKDDRITCYGVQKALENIAESGYTIWNIPILVNKLNEYDVDLYFYSGIVKELIASCAYDEPEIFKTMLMNI